MLNLMDSSESAKVEIGILQESVLGPLLFLLYINDMDMIINKNCELRLFAGNAVIPRDTRALQLVD